MRYLTLLLSFLIAVLFTGTAFASDEKVVRAACTKLNRVEEG